MSSSSWRSILVICLRVHMNAVRHHAQGFRLEAFWIFYVGSWSRISELYSVVQIVLSIEDFYNLTIILDISYCTTLFTLAIQCVCGSSEVALESWRSCSLMESALVQVVVLTEVSTTYVSLDRSRSRSRSRSYFTTASQSESMSWYRASLWDLRPDITSCRNVAVWNLRSCVYGAPSLTRGRVCNLQCNHSMVRVTHNPTPYFTVSSETPPTWRARFPYSYPPGTGWPSYTPGHWVPFTSSLMTRRATVEVF
jgi:hypothetical protein